MFDHKTWSWTGASPVHDLVENREHRRLQELGQKKRIPVEPRASGISIDPAPAKMQVKIDKLKRGGI